MVKALVWVDDDFKVKLKKEAAEAKLPVIEFTRRMAKDLEPVKRQLEAKKIARGRYEMPKF